LPAGVDPLVIRVSIVEQDGVQDPDENEADVPEGRPEKLKEMG
jgi:hypothetical protein